MKILKTNHGLVRLPAFMPVATKGVARNLSPQDLKAVGVEIILANVYHLWQRPGIEIIKKAGGLHKFMNWSSPILTDSGGYQAFSLAKFRRLLPAGIEFHSELDGQKIFLTPEKVIKAQKDLGVDIAMALDVNTPYPCSRQEAAKAVALTSGWARIARQQKLNPGQKLFAIIQGSVFRDLRLTSAKELLALNFDGYAIGGECQAKGKKELYKVLDWVCPLLPKNKPIYLMGIGRPEDIKTAIKAGVNMFDCAAPTREARHGRIYLRQKKFINLTNKKYQTDFSPLDKNCTCSTCQNFTRSYIHHLFKIKEGLVYRLASVHNLKFLLDAVKKTA